MANLIDSLADNIMHIAGRTYASLAFENKKTVNKNRGDLRNDSESLVSAVNDGESQVRIENDIKEMEALLPPLLDARSTNNFF